MTVPYNYAMFTNFVTLFIGISVVLLVGIDAAATREIRKPVPLPSPSKLNSNTIPGISCDFEEACQWKWDEGDAESGTTGFQLTTGKDVREIRMGKADPVYDYSGPHYDPQNDTEGKALPLFTIKLIYIVKYNFQVSPIA